MRLTRRIPSAVGTVALLLLGAGCDDSFSGEYLDGVVHVVNGYTDLYIEFVGASGCDAVPTGNNNWLASTGPVPPGGEASWVLGPGCRIIEVRMEVAGTSGERFLFRVELETGEDIVLHVPPLEDCEPHCPID